MPIRSGTSTRRLTVELGDQFDEARCACCDLPFVCGRGRVRRNGHAHATYYVNLYERHPDHELHPDRRALLLVTLDSHRSRWRRPGGVRRSVWAPGISVIVAVWTQGEAIGCGVEDPDASPWTLDPAHRSHAEAGQSVGRSIDRRHLGDRRLSVESRPRSRSPPGMTTDGLSREVADIRSQYGRGHLPPVAGLPLEDVATCGTRRRRPRASMQITEYLALERPRRRSVRARPAASRHPLCDAEVPGIALTAVRSVPPRRMDEAAPTPEHLWGLATQAPAAQAPASLRPMYPRNSPRAIRDPAGNPR
jgi:hypothetical protein